MMLVFGNASAEWKYRETADEITGKKNVDATLEFDAVRTGMRSATDRAWVGIYCFIDSSKELSVTMQVKDYLHIPIPEKMLVPVKYRIDKGKVVSENWVLRPNILMAVGEYAKRFANALVTGKEEAVFRTDVGMLESTVFFGLIGSASPIRKALSACGK